LDLSAPGDNALMAYLRERNFVLLPNTAGCYSAEEAVRTCRLARELGMSGLVKLEVIGDPGSLFPDVVQTLEAARTLVKDGFAVLPYTTDDPITARKLQDVGCVAVMPLAAPIGSGLGIQNRYNIEIMRSQLSVPLIVDAGVGTASDAAIAMELGCDGVLMQTAIAGADEPVRMARAMRLAVEAGRQAFLAGRIPKRLFATASSPLQGVIGSKQ
jgi:thiazole synthase